MHTEKKSLDIEKKKEMISKAIKNGRKGRKTI